MTDAIPSDHPAVDSYRVELSTVGSTSRPQIVLPGDLECDVDDFVRVVVGGARAHAQVDSTLAGRPVLRGAYANKRLARTTDGENVLAEWLDDEGFQPGTTLVVDVLTDGYAYGIREPGTRVVYEPIEKPDSSLSEIADSL
ncbi:hypothetical protein GRX03_13540 [Halovenus sp. WSH3]|uniref:Uncharacterized protein n=1 Tax=Halovenus carboxidivorans TaxID=2692199 RepID=A0A6B0T3J3_9EURY|nr:hypothetical protein [Halovenus carboxidivorans]MXR52624.1 hypothetical protein [Halovenus carboxidivorans]